MYYDDMDKEFEVLAWVPEEYESLDDWETSLVEEESTNMELVLNLHEDDLKVRDIAAVDAQHIWGPDSPLYRKAQITVELELVDLLREAGTRAIN